MSQLKNLIQLVSTQKHSLKSCAIFHVLNFSENVENVLIILVHINENNSYYFSLCSFSENYVEKCSLINLVGFHFYGTFQQCHSKYISCTIHIKYHKKD